MRLFRMTFGTALAIVGAVAIYGYFSGVKGSALLQATVFSGPALLFAGLYVVESVLFANPGIRGMPGGNAQRIGLMAVISATLLGVIVGSQAGSRNEGLGMIITILVILLIIPGVVVFTIGMFTTIIGTLFGRERN